MKTLLSLVLGCLSPFAALAAERVAVTVTHDLDAPRPAQTITVPWKEIAAQLPGALLQHLAVKDSSGRSLPYQVTNIAPQAKDPKGIGIAYGELIFQHDFGAEEKSATFIIEKTDALAPVFPAKAFARYVPERLDDFAWENDRIAHRTYGPALAAPDEPKTGKEVLVTSGLDVWCKRVNHLIVDRWYNKGHDHYHKDEGEGMDMYQVGPSRGCGGTGVWDGRTLAVSRNYQTWKILANGPVRAVFELGYDTWDAQGFKVRETKRFTVDAGHNLDLIESTFTVAEGTAPAELIVAVGLNRNPADKGQEPVIDTTPDATAATLTQWIAQKTNGSLGTAVVVDAEAFKGFAKDDRNELVLARVTPGKPLRYLAGAGWSKAGEFTSKDVWNAYVSAQAARLRSPLKVSVSAAP